MIARRTLRSKTAMLLGGAYLAFTLGCAEKNSPANPQTAIQSAHRPEPQPVVPTHVQPAIAKPEKAPAALAKLGTESAKDDWLDGPARAKPKVIRLQPVEPDPNAPPDADFKNLDRTFEPKKIETAASKPAEPLIEVLPFPEIGPELLPLPARAKVEKAPETKAEPQVALPAKKPAGDIAKLFAERIEPEPLAPVFLKRAPESIDDLRDIQDQLAKAIDRVMPSVVSVRVGASSGSCVIVTKDGYMMTAGHVSGSANRPCTVLFHNGKTAKGITLGGNHGIDSGMIKITTEGDWVPAEIADSSQVRAGQWCFVAAHPGGFKQGRSPPVRLGRILRVTATTITTDCTLVGGDSGGPLFDMHGRVIGINSRIGQSIESNMHVPSNPFLESWDRLARGEVFGGNKFGGGAPKGAIPPPKPASPYLGATIVEGDICVVEKVEANSPAAMAGIKVGDIVVKFDGKKVATAEAFVGMVQSNKVGDRIEVDVRRGAERLTLTVQIGKR